MRLRADTKCCCWSRATSAKAHPAAAPSWCTAASAIWSRAIFRWSWRRCSERGLLRQNAPHLVSDLAFVVPSYDWWEAPFYGLGPQDLRPARGQIRLRPVANPVARRNAGAAADDQAGRSAWRSRLLRRPIRRRPVAQSIWCRPPPNMAQRLLELRAGHAVIKGDDGFVAGVEAHRCRKRRQNSRAPPKSSSTRPARSADSVRRLADPGCRRR